MRPLRPALLFVSALLGAGVLVARPSGQAAVIPGTRIGTAELDVRLTELMARAKVPGLAVAVIDSGRIVHRKAYGLADIDQKRSLTTDTIMYRASLTKAAFAYMTLQLVDEGAPDLDAPITTLLKKPLPEYAQVALSPAQRGVLVRAGQRERVCLLLETTRRLEAEWPRGWPRRRLTDRAPVVPPR